MKMLLIFVIGTYKNCISPFLPSSCRFYPSCSDYCIEAISEHGILKGLLLSAVRLGRCHPFHDGGHDPVTPNADRHVN